MKKLVLSALAAAAVCGIANAKEIYGEVDHPITPFTFAVADPIQLPLDNWRTYGLRMDLFVGRSFSVYGADVGLVGMTVYDFRGAAFGAANWVEGDMYGVQLAAIGNVVNGYTWGWQVAGIVNYNQTSFAGLQTALINFNGVFTGLQFGLLDWNRGVCYGLEIGGVNVNDSELHGWTIGAINYSARLYGTQIGVVNVVPEKGRGLQLGVFNAAESFQGVQIGLLNIIGDGAMPVFPVINANF